MCTAGEEGRGGGADDDDNILFAPYLSNPTVAAAAVEHHPLPISLDRSKVHHTQLLDGFICIIAPLLPSGVFMTEVVRLRHVASAPPIGPRRGGGVGGGRVVLRDKGVAVKSERGWWRGSFIRSCSSRP